MGSTDNRMYVWVFPVGRGNAALIRTPLNHGFIVDMGNSEDCDPATFIRENLSGALTPFTDPAGNAFPIAQAVLSHQHSDHIGQCAELIADDKVLYPYFLTCPHDLDVAPADDEKLNWGRVVNPAGSDDLVTQYKELYKDRTPPLQSVPCAVDATCDDLEYGIFYVRPPHCESIHESDDNAYGNATSIVVYFRYGDDTILFPGDITPEAMQLLLDDAEQVEKRYTVFGEGAMPDDWSKMTVDQPGLRSLLEDQGLSVLVAPHHGLESCYSQELYDAMKDGAPQLVVISEKKHLNDNDGSLATQYQSDAGALGLNVDVGGTVEKRRSVSTVDGHHVLIVFDGQGTPEVHLAADPDDLLPYWN